MRILVFVLSPSRRFRRVGIRLDGTLVPGTEARSNQRPSSQDHRATEGRIATSDADKIAMVAAMQYPERVNKLVLISPAGFERFEEGEGDWLSGVVTPELVRDTSIRRIAVNLQANFFRPPAEAEFMITDRIRVRGADDFENYCYAVSKNVAAMLDEPVWDRLDQISLPTLIILMWLR